MGEVVNVVIVCGANKIIYRHFSYSDERSGC